MGLTVGVKPNVEFLRGSKIEVDRGVLVNDCFETNIEGAFAIGDCAQFRNPEVAHRPIEQLWYTARKHGRTVAETLAGVRTPYQRGVFFNSAKFFTLEYQTYGDIRSDIPDDQETLVWRGEGDRRLVRVNFERDSRRVVGFNALGVRLRHDMCELWIRSGARVDEVIRDLSRADFDPEWSPGYLVQAAEVFNT